MKHSIIISSLKLIFIVKVTRFRMKKRSTSKRKMEKKKKRRKKVRGDKRKVKKNN